MPRFGGHRRCEGRVRDARDPPADRAEVRHQIVELAQAGRTPAELSREFGCSVQSITNWIAQAANDPGQLHLLALLLGSATVHGPATTVRSETS